MSSFSLSNILVALIAVWAIVYTVKKNKATANVGLIDYAELQKAIEAHAIWKQRFVGLVTGVINGSITMHDTKTFDYELVEQDNQCELGRWLHGDGMAKLSDNPQFIDLVDTHRCFHHYAGQMIQMMLAGKHREVAHQLSKNGEFEQNSQKLSRQLTRLYRGERRSRPRT